jgi:NAD(P)-dependent dehydrogenase (short-subunit alcohol dehydrogenase family)
MTSYDYRGKVALVTGGSAGIGRATAAAFLRAGARVVIAARDEAAGKAAETALAATTEAGNVCFLRLDVRREEDVAAVVAGTTARFGRLDFAFNNAGAGGDLAPLERSSQAVWDDVLATNARGVWLCMRHQIPALLAGGGGAIVNMSSVFGLAGKPAHHAYVAAKHAVIGMTRSVALEYAARGIRINALCPGATATESMRQAAVAFPAAVDALVDAHPMKRLATEDEIADAVLWLCSAGAGFVTGTPLAVDGGYLAA